MQQLLSALLLSGVAATGVSAQQEPHQRDLAVTGVTDNKIGDGGCLDSSGFAYEKNEISYAGGGGTLDGCIAQCPSVHLVGVEDDSANSKCYCLYRDNESPNEGETYVDFVSQTAAGNGTGFPSSVDADGTLDCYKNTRPQDTYLLFTSEPDLTLSGGIHTVRITYDRSVGWDWDVKYYEVYKDDENNNKCNFTDAAEITSYLDAATEEAVNAIDPVDSYPRQNVTVKIDFNEPQETTFCVRTKLVDPFAPNPVVNFDEQILTVKLTTDNIFVLEDADGIDLAEADANTVSQDFTYTLEAYECPEGFEPKAENISFGTSQDGSIKLCIKTSSDEVVVDNDSLTVNVTQNGTDYTDTHGMTEGNPNGFLATMDGTSDGNTTNSTTRRLDEEGLEGNAQQEESQRAGYMRRLASNGRIARCAFLPVEAMYVNGNPITFSGEADILFADSGGGRRRLEKAKFQFRVVGGGNDDKAADYDGGVEEEDDSGRALQGDDKASNYAGHGGFQLGVPLPPRGQFDSDVSIDYGVGGDENKDIGGVEGLSDESYSSAPPSFTSKSFRRAVLAPLVVAAALFA